MLLLSKKEELKLLMGFEKFTCNFSVSQNGAIKQMFCYVYSVLHEHRLDTNLATSYYSLYL